jgi:hypothetical protein
MSDINEKLQSAPTKKGNKPPQVAEPAKKATQNQKEKLKFDESSDEDEDDEEITDEEDIMDELGSEDEMDSEEEEENQVSQSPKEKVYLILYHRM